MKDKLVFSDKLETPKEALDAFREIAIEIGRQVSFHIETMYPEAVKAASSTFLLSVRGCTANAIMGLKEDKHGMSLVEWLDKEDKHRRKIRKLQKAANVEEVQEIIHEK